jgi:beta-glucosidase
VTERHPFRDTALPIGKRIDDLLGRPALGERIALLHQYAPDVERLGIASFRTGPEALHGVSWLGEATVFPQSSTGADGTPDGSTLSTLASQAVPHHAVPPVRHVPADANGTTQQPSCRHEKRAARARFSTHSQKRTTG